MNVYLVEAEKPHSRGGAPLAVRYVMVAPTASEAERVAVETWGLDSTCRVGRLGAYEPGIDGSRMVLATYPILAIEIGGRS